MNILTFEDHQAPAEGDASILVVDNTVDPRALALDGVTRIDLNFPKFTDGRAYSQAYLLRRRLGFAGEIRATGDVLIDQLVQMARSGFSTAVLREGLSAGAAQRQFARFKAFYQGDAAHPAPHFADADKAAANAAEVERPVAA